MSEYAMVPPETGIHPEVSVPVVPEKVAETKRLHVLVAASYIKAAEDRSLGVAVRKIEGSEKNGYADYQILLVPDKNGRYHESGTHDFHTKVRVIEYGRSHLLG